MADVRAVTQALQALPAGLLPAALQKEFTAELEGYLGPGFSCPATPPAVPWLLLVPLGLLLLLGLACWLRTRAL